TCKQAVEGCGELCDLILAANRQFRALELPGAYLISHGGEPTYRPDDQQNWKDVGGKDQRRAGEGERQDERMEGLGCNADRYGGGYRDDLRADDLVGLPAKTMI